MNHRSVPNGVFYSGIDAEALKISVRYCKDRFLGMYYAQPNSSHVHFSEESGIFEVYVCGIAGGKILRLL